MPVLTSTFSPPALLRQRHGQTVLPALLPCWERPEWRRERLELVDGDFLDLDWSPQRRDRLVILSHGLEGSSRAVYIQRMRRALDQAGWDSLAWNYRGCSGTPNRLPRAYHSGDSADLRSVIAHAARRYDQIALVGFSLGGNVTLKYLAECPPAPQVVAGIAISTPVDLASSAMALDNRAENRIYLRRFVSSLVDKVSEKAALFPDHLSTAGLGDIRTFAAFDDRYTAPLHGFQSAADYWARCSSLPLLPQIRTRTLLLNAQDDPFLTSKSIPTEIAAASAHLYLEAPSHGGHLGFLSRLFPYPNPNTWINQRIVAFLANH